MWFEQPDWATGGRWFKWVGGVLNVWTPGGELFEAPVPPMRDGQMIRAARARMPIPEPSKSTPCPIAIRSALEARGMSGWEVSVAVGEGVVDVTGWKNGTIVPTETQVRRVATLTSLPVDVFYSSPY